MGYPSYGNTSANLNDLAIKIYNANVAKGFWNFDVPRSFAEIIALIHSEASEALEEFRAGHAISERYYREDGKPEGVPSELADIIIRVLDVCGAYRLDIDAVIKEKLAFNATREHKHGKQF